jgi:hypothetical protein
MQERLKEADANGDGKIQRDEVPDRMTFMFDRLDTNDDEVISEAEMKAMIERMRAEQGGEEAAEEPAAEPAEQPVTEEPAEQAVEITDDPITGEWSGKASNENIPPDSGGFTLKLKMASDGTVTGQFDSQFNAGDIEPGKYDPKSKKLRFTFQGDQMDLHYEATIGESGMNGTLEVGEGMFSMDISVTRTSTEYVAVGGEEGDDAGPVDGYEWKPIKDLVPGPRWVSCLETSRFEAGRVYLTLDGHRSDDDAPYPFVSEDYGRTWRSLQANLPDSVGSTRVLREDITNPDILYLGTEFSAWVSIDRGTSWTSLNTNLPTVAIHEIAQHPTSGEIIAGTHGRSIWILDVAPLRQMSQETLANGSNLFKPADAHYWRTQPSRGGDLRRFVGQNPSGGVAIYYTLDGGGEASLKVTDAGGRTIRDLPTESGSRLHRVTWDLRSQRRNTQGRGGRGGRGGRFGGPRVAPGTYHVVLTVGEDEYKESFKVNGDPEFPSMVLWGEEYDEMLEMIEQMEGEDGDEEEADASETIW